MVLTQKHWTVRENRRKQGKLILGRAQDDFPILLGF
jgi:hypothetical protein